MSSVALVSFLDLISWSEGTINGLDRGYGVIVSGIDGAHSFTDYSAHPFAAGRPPIVVNHRKPPMLSTASGRYQIRLETWREVSAHLGLSDFSPASQDAAAVELIRRRGALGYVEGWNISKAIYACSLEWASFPGNSYDQPGGRSIDQLMATFQDLADRKA